ncbi:Ig-like domain-containing protein [Cytobacillus purgationiresistens]|uniref:Uncharacterized protein YjdB n=1 Tax=Cytobacillus purgationiresistens TaxID=863449 RepID=A0ABU0ADC0_9BACI|nr:Ig-like domain-containing protein [Cytobacillus purgationiresistens]MDQ0268879.1 uncharacterized protein YjdB [Cytobacillus purgationiresistens]
MSTTYNVYRDGEKIATGLSEKSFTDNDLTPNTVYEYQVSAVNQIGESELSTSTSVTTDFSQPTEVSVSPATNNLTVGGKRNLSFSILPDTAKQEVIWSSSSNATATVNAAGEVTAIAPGSATITAKAKDKEVIAGTASVSVTQPVTSVTLNKTILSLDVSVKEKLTATVSPANASNKNITWSSSLESIATVGSDGTVTAVSAGESTITVKTADGNKTATCVVTVNEVEPDPPEEGE